MGKKKAKQGAAAPPTFALPDALLVSKGNERVFGNHCIGLVRRIWGLPTLQPFAFPSRKVIDDHDGDRGNTPNQRGLARAWDYGAAMAAGVPAPFERRRLIDFFVKQRTTEGLQYAEENTTSHGPLWILIGASAHALALHYHDEELLAETGYWWRARASLDDALLDTDGHWTAPSGRSAGDTFDYGTVTAHMIRGTEPPEMSLIPNARGGQRPLIGPKFWQDPNCVGVGMMRTMIEKGDTLGGATEGERAPVVLRDELLIYRRGDEYVKVFPRMRSSEAMFWCAKLKKKPTVPHVETSAGRYAAPHKSGRFPQGLMNPFPEPTLAGSKSTIIPGVGA